MRGAMWAQGTGCLEDCNKAMFEAVWVNERNMAETDEIFDVMAECGLNGDAMAEAIQQPKLKTKLIEVTEGAVARGVFGAPTMFVGDEMHFGQDRLDWVARALDRD